MRAFMRKIDRFCYKHPRFGVSNLMLYVVIGNALVWLFSLMDTTGLLISMLRFNPHMILRGQIWRLFTFALIPNSSGILTLIFLYFYYFIGRSLEVIWGKGRFTIYFAIGLLFTILYGFIIYLVFRINLSVDASYIYLSMFFSFATFYPNQGVLLFFIIPIKMKWLAIVDAVFFLYAIITSPFPVNILPVVAMLNYFLFCGGILFSAVSGNKRVIRKKTIDFKTAAEKVNRERAAAPYKFKCEVCGRTDISDPQLDFRYCSRCAGYHCFCVDHINAHNHYTE